MTLLASGLVKAKPKYPKGFDLLVTGLQMEPQKDITSQGLALEVISSMLWIMDNALVHCKDLSLELV